MSSAASLLAAVNGALALLCQPPLTSLDEEKNAARVMKSLWRGVLDDCLVEHTWNFAEHEFVPGGESATPDARGWYRHPLPEACLQIVSVAGLGADEWKVVGPSDPDAPEAQQARILAARALAPSVTATWRITNAGLWSPKFRSTFETRLAEAAAGPLARDEGAADRLEAKGKRRLLDAKRRDGQEGAPKTVPDGTSWLAARRGWRR